MASDNGTATTDGVWSYGINILKSFLLLAGIKDAVATRNGEYLSALRKQLLMPFFSISGFNEFAIEMLINILQTKVLLSEAESQRCKWLLLLIEKAVPGRTLKSTYFKKTAIVK